MFETRIELEVPGRPSVRSEGRLVLDDHGRLVSGYERSDAAELRFEREGNMLAVSDGTDTEKVAYAPGQHDTAFMAHSAILHEELMYALRPLREGAQHWRLVSLSGGLPMEWEGEVRDTGEGIRIDTSLGEVVELRDGRLLSVDVESSDLAVRPLDPAADEALWPTWEIVGPRTLAYRPPAGAVFEPREVELPGRPGDPVLWGEVLVPTGGQAPFPGVVFLSPTGQEDRHGFAGPPPVDLGSHEITDALADAGFVVMRFDDRGHGKSEAGEISFLAQVEDGRRALRTLLVQPEVDPDRIVVVGHGEGGLRALHLGVAQPEAIRGIALLAAPGRPYREIFLRQIEAPLANLPPQVRNDARAEQHKMLEALEGGGEVPPELEPQAKWLREMLQQKPAELVAQVDAVLWIAQGDKDFEIDPRADPAALLRAAKKAKKQVSVRHYPSLDHLFKPEPGESTPDRYLLPDRSVDGAFLTDLVAWARKVCG